jgi:anti-sigma regulatory factor (Ser/Thr protein kinase)
MSETTNSPAVPTVASWPSGQVPGLARVGGCRSGRTVFMTGVTSTQAPSHGASARPALKAGTDAAAAPAQPRGQGATPSVPLVPHSRMSGWPMRDFLELGALPGAVPCARLHARHIMQEWALAPLTDAIELLVAELLTNAIRASRAYDQDSPVRLWLLSDRTSVLILAWDANPQPPASRRPGADDENGRGLLLVEAVSADWAWYIPGVGTGTASIAGKTVWSLVQ